MALHWPAGMRSWGAAGCWSPARGCCRRTRYCEGHGRSGADQGQDDHGRLAQWLITVSGPPLVTWWYCNAGAGVEEPWGRRRVAGRSAAAPTAADAAGGQPHAAQGV